MSTGAETDRGTEAWPPLRQNRRWLVLRRIYRFSCSNMGLPSAWYFSDSIASPWHT